ncbi:MAG TPA: hypothetical protein VNI01_14130 [Elusimicrobiota bacterium]|jgi:hypothetical protein|nr:hypothetical protein [Elusimicrobiota bacterium]
MKPASIIVLSALLGAGFLSGCAFLNRDPGPRLSASPAIPAAEGHAKFGSAPNGNTSIDLTVKHLADPRKLTPPANNYVVWLRASAEAAAQNIGALTVDKNLVGRLTTVTGLRTFDLFVTAETSGQVQKPSGQPLLWTSHSN